MEVLQGMEVLERVKKNRTKLRPESTIVLHMEAIRALR